MTDWLTILIGAIGMALLIAGPHFDRRGLLTGFALIVVLLTAVTLWG